MTVRPEDETPRGVDLVIEAARILAREGLFDIALEGASITKLGEPRHPLYLSTHTEPVRWA